MVKLFKKTVFFLQQQQKDIFSAAFVIMSAVAFSRILGLFRDRLLAARFTPKELGVYYAAFRLPNLIFELLVMGALASAFIPVFTSLLEKEGKEKAFQMAASVINIGLVIFVLLSLPLFLLTREICSLFAPGFSEEEITLMTSFTRLMVFAQVFPLLVGNFFTGILQSFRNFLIPALAPIVYNLGIIFGIIFFTPYFGLFGPVYGVILGAVFFGLIQLPFVWRLGYRHLGIFSFTDKNTRLVGKLMLPRTLGLAVSQIDITIDLVLSSLLGTASVTMFNFAQHLQQLPIGLFGASIAQAALPSLSTFFAQKNLSEFKKTFLSSFNQILFFVVPLSAILIVLRIPIVRLVFGASTLFDWGSTVMTARTLAFFGLSLFAQAEIHLLVRGFYALQDTQTPVVMGMVAVLFNTLLSLIFILYFHLAVWALGLSASLASILNMLFLFFLLEKKVGLFNRFEFFLSSLKIFLAGIFAGVALYIPIKLLDQLVFDTTKTVNLLILTAISTFFGLLVYFFLAWFLEIPQIAIFARFFRKMGLRRLVIFDTSQEVVEGKNPQLT